MQVGHRTDPGRERPSNEDAYLTKLSRPWKVLAVADGMGGHVGGEVASSIAVETLQNGLKDSVLQEFTIDINQADNYFRSLLDQANNRIWELSQQQNLQGMGTTLSVVFIQGFQALIGHIGDSRIYLIRNGIIDLISRDHSLVEEMVQNGQLRESEAVNHPQKHVLTRALGTQNKANFDFYPFALQAGDILLLCSDGLSNMLASADMQAIIMDALTLQQAADKLVEAANQKGGCDNITVVLALLEAGDEVI